MVSRYDICLKLAPHWPLLSFKGDAHTYGIYFNQEFGYVIERTYCLRMRHNEPSPSVFFTPAAGAEEEGTVEVFFPYHGLTKRPNKYQLLFKENQLSEQTLPALFEGEPRAIFELTLAPMIDLLETMPKKRDRDRTWLVVQNGRARMFQKTKNTFQVSEQINITSEKSSFIVNANTLLHALKLFSGDSAISFSVLHGKIILNQSEIEAVLSMAKPSIQKEIEYQANK